MPEFIFIFQQWFIALIHLAANGAAALPLIISLGFVAGRRGNGRFCIQGNSWLLTLCLPLSFCGIFWLAAEYFSIIMSHAAQQANVWKPLLESAGMPYTSSGIAWLCGIIFIALARYRLNLIPQAAVADRYNLAFVRLPLVFCLAAAFCFFMVFILINWPFAGLPPQLDMDRAIMAIGRNAMRRYFMAFCPAGAIGLLFAPLLLNKCADSSYFMGIRWLALWAAIGHFPHILQSWALTIGLGMRGNLSGSLASGFLSQALANVFLTAAIACWCWLFFYKKKCYWPIWASFALLALSESVPFLFKFHNLA